MRLRERSEDDEASQGCSGFVRSSQRSVCAALMARKEILQVMAMPVDARSKGAALIVEENARLKRIVKLSRQHPRYGYRRITALLRREGDRVEREVYGTGAEG
jgi:hypothetical protein